MAVAVVSTTVVGFPQESESKRQDPYSRQRLTMVTRQVESRGIKDSLTLAALRTVKRHLFVPEDLTEEAYEDGPLPIGYGQTISQPYIVALMTELMHLGPFDRVLEIGTGSGYQAAVLSEITDSVLTVEIIEELAHSARARLQRLGYSNVQVRNADGYNGWPDGAPYDAIIVTAAAEHIPPPLLSQLKNGGRMVIPIGHPFFVQNLIVVEKENGIVHTQTIIPVRFVPLTRSQ